MVKDKGTYALVLCLDKEAAINVGRLGKFSFPSGYYLYVGSALKGLSARVRRHVQGGEKLRWHIDYLRQQARVVEVWYLISEERLECSCSQAAASMPDSLLLVAGFGSSDCGCSSHLFYLNSKPSFETFCHLLGEKGRGLARISLK